MESNSGRGGGAAGGRGRGRGDGGRGNQGGVRGYNQNQSNQSGGRGYNQNQSNRGGGRGYNQNQSNRGGGTGWGEQNRGSHHQPAQPHCVGRPPVQGNQQQARGYRPPQGTPIQHPCQKIVGPAGGSAGPWTGRPWGPSSPSSSPVQSVPSPKATSSQPSPVELGLEKLKNSEAKAESSSADCKEIESIKRPDTGGKLAYRSIRLHVNHYPVKFDPEKTIFHYDVDVKPISNDNRVVRRTFKKPDMRVIRDKVFSEHQLPVLATAYDGQKNIFSAVQLPTGEFRVAIPEGEEVKSGSYMITVKFVDELKPSEVNDYIRGNLSYIPRDILQGMDLVMKDNPMRKRIMFGRSFYSYKYRSEDDLSYGIAAYKGFRQSLKPTSQGLALCLDYSVQPFRKPLPVIDYLKECIPEFRGANDVKRYQQEINEALEGLKVRVTHRRTKQKYTIAGLAGKDACDSSFELVDPEGNNPPRKIELVEYFRDKWHKDIMFKNIPCLELGKPGRSNEVPMEFCVLVEGQRYPKEHLDRNTALQLKKKSLVRPSERENTINEMVRSADGPCGDVLGNFGIEVDTNMTKVVGRVIGAPDLKTGAPRSVGVDNEKCQWNLLGRSFVDAKSLERWVLLDFTNGDRKNKLQASEFINNLKARCTSLGGRMGEPLLHHITGRYDFSSVDRLEKLLRGVMEKCSKITQEKLQMIVCVMTREEDPGYKYLKRVSETKIGVVTQCCLSPLANKGQDQYLANLCLKINAKLGGSNFELAKQLPHFKREDNVMFIGADVNHPGANNTSCPSIAAVVGTLNWPAANRYAARIRPQAHRKEEIVNFGDVCLELICNARINKVMPSKIVIFRDGVGEGQMKMVLNEELPDLKKALHSYDSRYKPRITLVVAQKRHQTRLFVDNGGSTGNVPPGTVVDTDIIHPVDFDFYLCSHYGTLGTSKPTHYTVLWDENFFSSDEMQQLIYDMCFTFARCTKPVSLVPPVYYADLVAYRGRKYQEVVMETQSHGASSSTASFNQSFYRLHSDLENTMFFV